LREKKKKAFRCKELKLAGKFGKKKKVSRGKKKIESDERKGRKVVGEGWDQSSPLDSGNFDRLYIKTYHRLMKKKKARVKEGDRRGKKNLSKGKWS